MILARHPEVLGQWTSHVSDRLADRPEVFAGSAAWWAYGAGRARADLAVDTFRAGRGLVVVRPGEASGAGRIASSGPGRSGPLILLSMATVKNAHYAIHALAPWSIWAAFGLVRVGDRLEARGRPRPAYRRRLAFVFVGLGSGSGWASGGVPRFDRRGVEWGFFERGVAAVGRDEPLVFLYDDWDRLPYPSPFGPVPHDLPSGSTTGGVPPSGARAGARGPTCRACRSPRSRATATSTASVASAGVEKVAQGPPAVGPDVRPLPGHAGSPGGIASRRVRLDRAGAVV